MSFLANIVTRYIRKLIIHQANAYGHNIDDIDMIVRIRNNSVLIITYSLQTRSVLSVLNNDEVERILKS